MEPEPENLQESTPPEPPVTAVPTTETTPVWAQTVPVAPPVSDNGMASINDTASEGEPLPAKPMRETRPDWTKTDPPAEADDASDPKQAVPMQKPTPTWAQTVPAPPGETINQTQAVETPVPAPKPTWPPAGKFASCSFPAKQT